MPAGVLNLLRFGADPTGSSDDTAAFGDALAQMPSAGRVLVVPPGIYNCDPGTILLPAKTALVGYGAGQDSAISEIRCNGDGNLVQFAGHGCQVRDIGLFNQAATPTAGAAIAAVTGTGNHALIQGVLSDGFFHGLDLRYGAEWRLYDSYISDPLSHGLLIDNIDLPDGGDQAISNVWFGCKDKTDDSVANAIYMTGGGGTKIGNIKINKGPAGTTGMFRSGIVLDVPSSCQTNDFLLSNASIENTALHGVVIALAAGAIWGKIVLTGVQMALYNSANGYGLFVDAADAGGATGLYVANSEIATTSSTNKAVTLHNVHTGRFGNVKQFGYAGMYTDSGGNSDIVFDSETAV